MAEKRTVAILGASGYTGAELLRLLAAHPYFDVVAVTASSNEGAAVADLYPALAGACPGLRFGPTEAAQADGADLVFEQSTEVPDALVPAAKYADMRAYFDRIGGSQAAPVVLVKK